jgi:hypothetical protein
MNDMHQFAKVRKPVFLFSAVLVIVVIVEFVLLEGTVGVSLPQDRNSAISRLEMSGKGTELHFITQNKRFTVVDLWTAHGSQRQALILRDSFFMDREDSVEGAPDATVAVEAMNGKGVRLTFHEPGERGDVVTSNLYMVTRFGGGEKGNSYTYFSLLDGRKVSCSHYSELSRDQLEALDRSTPN